MKRKKIMSAFLITAICTSVFFSSSVMAGDFTDLQDKCYSVVESDLPYNDSNTGQILEMIENYYFPAYGLTEWPGSSDDSVIYLACAASYLGYYCDDGTNGKIISDDLWKALESLYYGNGDFAEKMDLAKSDYEAITDTVLYENSYSEGQHKVGEDIPAGEYITFTSTGHGYYCVSSDSNGNDIIANENFEYNSFVTVNEGEYLELSGCKAVPVSEVTELPMDKADMFKVGIYLQAGEYKLNCDGDHGYYCVSSDANGSDIIANDNFEGQTYVTVSDGQYLKIDGCVIE